MRIKSPMLIVLTINRALSVLYRCFIVSNDRLSDYLSFPVLLLTIERPDEKR